MAIFKSKKDVKKPIKKKSSVKKTAKQETIPKKKPGPKTKYNPLYHPDVAYRLALEGFIDVQIAKEIGICKKSLYNWRNKYPEFDAAIARGKILPDDLVEKSLFQRAVGYSYPEDHIMQHQGKPIIVHTIKHVPPETKAAFIWLTNRRPDRWRYKMEIDVKQEVTFILPDDPRAKQLLESLEAPIDNN